MKFTMIYTDKRGETHFGAEDIPDREVAMGPPPNPTGQMNDLGAVRQPEIRFDAITNSAGIETIERARGQAR